LWAGRFGEGPSDELLAFTVSLPFDRRLAGDDLAGSRAHVRMLERVGSADEQERQASPPRSRAEEELIEGTFAFAPTDEDIHTAIERRVTEIAGATGAKLHTGRSRNDQIALDMRLYVRREGHGQAARIHELQTVLLRRAEEATDVYLPGYTHLQRAQPVLLAHHLLAHFWALGRDLDRWRDCLARADVSPLEAGVWPVSLPLTPDRINDLGFGRVRQLAGAVSSLVAETLSHAHAVHLAHRREIVPGRRRFGSCGWPARSTGSSMLPQRRTPTCGLRAARPAV
jgi:argininosuccinate lyase